MVHACNCCLDRSKPALNYPNCKELALLPPVCWHELRSSVGYEQGRYTKNCYPMAFKCLPHFCRLGWPEWHCYRVAVGLVIVRMFRWLSDAVNMYRFETGWLAWKTGGLEMLVDLDSMTDWAGLEGLLDISAHTLPVVYISGHFDGLPLTSMSVFM